MFCARGQQLIEKCKLYRLCKPVTDAIIMHPASGQSVPATVSPTKYTRQHWTPCVVCESEVLSDSNCERMPVKKVQQNDFSLCKPSGKLLRNTAGVLDLNPGWKVGVAKKASMKVCCDVDVRSTSSVQQINMSVYRNTHTHTHTTCNQATIPT